MLTANQKKTPGREREGQGFKNKRCMTFRRHHGDRVQKKGQATRPTPSSRRDAPGYSFREKKLGVRGPGKIALPRLPFN